MTTATLGKIDGAGDALTIDLDRLIETRILIQGGSGAGKSHTLRKLLEESHKYCQQIVIDKEGEFASLREKYDYILAGKKGDVPAEVRSAALLAKKTLELRTSIIIDISELKRDEREQFVANFLEALIDAPQSLWHPVLVVLDECDVFAPEGARSLSLRSVVDLAARGRKRGFCLVAATQRISKLDKDVAAECLNKLIGRTGLDIDMKRSADELGMSHKDRLELRDLEPGSFFAFGPAISKKVEAVTIGSVKTSHGGRQKKKTKAPPPTSKIKKILAQLNDIPAEAEQELKEKGEFKSKIRELEQALKKKAAGVPDPKALDRARQDGIKEGIKIMRDVAEKAFKELKKSIDVSLVGFWKAIANSKNAPKLEPSSPKTLPRLSSQPVQKSPANPSPRAAAGDGSWGKCERAILKFLAIAPERSFTKVQVGAMSGYSANSGSFSNAISKLTTAGLIQKTGRGLQLNDIDAAGSILGGDYDSGMNPRQALEAWMGKLGKAPGMIYNVLLNAGAPMSKADVAGATGYSAESGSFSNAISSLNTLGLIRRNGGALEVNPELLELEGL